MRRIGEKKEGASKIECNLYTIVKFIAIENLPKTEYEKGNIKIIL